MTISKIQILLDLNKRNEQDVLEEHASWADHGYLFVDSEDGQCYLFDRNGKLCDLKKIDAIYESYVNKDIKKIVIPKSVKNIKKWAFAHCKSLTSIEIPNSVEIIGTWAFENCTSLISIEIPNSVKRIGTWAFENCASLKSIEISESVKSIGYGAFADCTSLTSIIFKGKTIDQVKAIYECPWGIEDKAIIKCS